MRAREQRVDDRSEVGGLREQGDRLTVCVQPVLSQLRDHLDGALRAHSNTRTAGSINDGGTQPNTETPSDRRSR